MSESTYKSCAAQHFGPWMIEPQWFTQAVSAVKAGTFKADTVRDSSTGERLYDVQNGVACIGIAGQMTKGESSFGGASTVRTRSAIRKATNDSRVTSIVLQIDSPGGTVSGTADLAADVAAADLRKPVYAFIEDLGCSAAYWVASQARKVYANTTALVGSIGVVAVVEDTSGAMDKAGVKVHVISTGPYKGAFTDGAPVTDAHLADLQREVDQLNEYFMDGVARGRGMSIEQVKKVATGQVWLAAEAKQLGLIDEVSTLDAAMTAISTETKHMTSEQFRAFAAENPDDSAVKEIRFSGTKAAAADARAGEIARMKALVEACGGKNDLAVASFLAGQDADTAKIAADAVNKAQAESQAKLDAANAEIKRLTDLNAAGGHRGVGEKPAGGEKPAVDEEDSKAVAGAEWDNDPEVRKGYTTKDRYVAVRSREIDGEFKARGSTLVKKQR
jgi:signal peptide peptidase SppA